MGVGPDSSFLLFASVPQGGSRNVLAFRACPERVPHQPLGFPLGEPHNVRLQTAITMSALAMTAEPVDDLLLVELVEGG